MTSPVLDISHIGPGTLGGQGAIPVEQTKPSDFSQVEGETLERMPMIPPEIDISEEHEQRLINYLDQELAAAEGERWDFVDRLARLKRKYRTKFPEFPKDWPIANSSQIEIPIIRTAVQTAVSRLYQTIMAAEPPLSARTEQTEFQDIAFDFEKYFEIYAEEVLNLPEVMDTAITECVKLGTSVLEVTTLRETRAEVDYEPISNQYQKKIKTTYSGPILYNIPLEDFWIRPAFSDVKKAPWCGKVVRLTWSEIKAMGISGEFDPDKIDNLWRFRALGDRDVAKTTKTEEDIEQWKPQDRDQFAIHELSVRWDADGDGYDEEIMVYYHRDSRTLLRRKYSGFRARPWRVLRFIPIEHWFYGEGLAEILEHLQEEISTIHNQRIDNATIANLKIILVARLIQGLKPGDRLWTGKIVRVGNVKEDVGTLQLGEIYPSTVANEQIANNYVSQVSGIGEAATGTAKPVSRTTAAAQLALLEELNRRFDKVLKGFRRTLAYVYRDLTALFARDGLGGRAQEWLGEARGARLDFFFSLPADHVLRLLKIQVHATKSTQNREVEFQSNIAVLQLINQLGQNVMQLGQSFAPQALPVLAHELVKAYVPIFKKVMQYAGATDADQAVSVLTVLERILPAPEDLGGMGNARADEARLAIEQLAGRVRGELGGPRESPEAEELSQLAGIREAVGRGNGASQGISGPGELS